MHNEEDKPVFSDARSVIITVQEYLEHQDIYSISRSPRNPTPKDTLYLKTALAEKKLVVRLRDQDNFSGVEAIYPGTDDNEIICLFKKIMEGNVFIILKIEHNGNEIEIRRSFFDTVKVMKGDTEYYDILEPLTRYFEIPTNDEMQYLVDAIEAAEVPLKFSMGSMIKHNKQDLALPHLETLAKAVDKATVPITLELGSHYIYQEECRRIAEIIKAAKHKLTLSLLCSQHIGPDCAKILADSIQNAQTELDLNLRVTDIGDEGVDHICKALKTVKYPISLNLMYNKLSEKSAKSIADAVALASTAISIDYRNNVIENHNISKEALRHFASAIANAKSSFTLILSEYRIGDEGAKILAEGLSKARADINLRIAYNDITTKGAEYIANAISETKANLDIDISSNYIELGGSRIILKQIEEANGNRSLSITLGGHLTYGEFYHKIDVEALCDAIKNTKAQISLTIKSTVFSDEDISSISKAIRETKAKKLTLHLDNTDGWLEKTPQEYIVALSAAMKALPGNVVLKFSAKTGEDSHFDLEELKSKLKEYEKPHTTVTINEMSDDDGDPTDTDENNSGSDNPGDDTPGDGSTSAPEQSSMSAGQENHGYISLPTNEEPEMLDLYLANNTEAPVDKAKKEYLESLESLNEGHDLNQNITLNKYIIPEIYDAAPSKHDLPDVAMLSGISS